MLLTDFMVGVRVAQLVLWGRLGTAIYPTVAGEGRGWAWRDGGVGRGVGGLGYWWVGVVRGIGGGGVGGYERWAW